MRRYSFIHFFGFNLEKFSSAEGVATRIVNKNFKAIFDLELIHEIYICSNFVMELHIIKLLLRKILQIIKLHNINIITYISNIPQHLFRFIQFILFFFFQIFNS